MSTILKAEQISRTYHTGTVKVEALRNCDLSIEKGEFVAVVGKSGSGKSTLLRILASLDRPDSGIVYVDGIDIFTLDEEQLSAFRRREIGFIYQEYNLFPEFTAYQNIIMPFAFDNRDPDEEWIHEILEQLGIMYCKNKYPWQMSGGEQQRVSIARALATRPAVIYAVEPTGNLDAASANSVARLLSIASQKYEQTIIMVTHDRQMADYADRLLTIVDGMIME